MHVHSMSVFAQYSAHASCALNLFFTLILKCSYPDMKQGFMPLLDKRWIQEVSGLIYTAFPQVASQSRVHKLEFLESFRHLWDSVTESDTKHGLFSPLTLTGRATGDAFFRGKRSGEKKEITEQERDNMTHRERERQLDHDPVG